MHTVKIEIEDNIYKKIVDSGIDIQEKLSELLYNLFDDGYPAISTEEAKKRVADTLQRYANDPKSFTPFDLEYKKELESYIESL